MSNVNNPHGLMPMGRTEDGGPLQTLQFQKASGYAYAIYQWDPVTELAGVLNGPANGITPGTTRYRGVALNAGLASLLTYHAVIASRSAIFDVQEDNSGAANVVAAKMGYNANLTTTAGDATLKRSKVQLSGTSIATTGSLDVRIKRLVNDPTNDYGAYARLEVVFNKHQSTPEQTAT